MLWRKSPGGKKNFVTSSVIVAKFGFGSSVTHAFRLFVSIYEIASKEILMVSFFIANLES
jgi:hypothetical protein